jgi:hypothetical protein
LSRTPARITQAEVARTIRAARQADAKGVEVCPDRTTYAHPWPSHGGAFAIDEPKSIELIYGVRVAWAATGTVLVRGKVPEGTPAVTIFAKNPLGSLTVATFKGLPVCDQHRLEEFDDWCAYSHEKITQQGKGARQ